MPVDCAKTIVDTSIMRTKFADDWKQVHGRDDDSKKYRRIEADSKVESLFRKTDPCPEFIFERKIGMI